MADDEAPIRFAATRILKWAGHDVSEACDGRQVILRVTTAAESRDPIDLILLDLQMPLIGGQELLDELSGIHGCPAILVMTGSMDVHKLNLTRSGICVGVITKPFDQGALLEKVADSLALGIAHTAEQKVIHANASF